MRKCRCGCGKSAELVCSYCKSAVYFDAEHSKRDWPIHRQMCFAETGLDEPTETEGVGGRAILSEAISIPKESLIPLDRRTLDILKSKRNILYGVFCIAADKFDRKLRTMHVIYPGVAFRRGALYVRGVPGTEDFNRSMAKLSNLGSDTATQTVLRKHNADYAVMAAREFVSVSEELKLPVTEEMELLAMLTEFGFIGAPDSIPGYKDIQMATLLTERMRALMKIEIAKSGGTVKLPFSPQQIDLVLNGVWSRVDLGLFSTLLETVSLGERLRNIPHDLLAMCTRFTTIDGDLTGSMEVMRMMPNLREVTVSCRIGVRSGEDVVQATLDLFALLSNMPYLSTLRILDDTDLDTDVDPILPANRLKKLDMWFPKSLAIIPSTVEDLTLFPRTEGEDKITDIGMPLGSARLSVRNLRLQNLHDRHRILDRGDADFIAAAFPNLTGFYCDIGYETWDRNDDRPEFFERVLQSFPRLSDLSMAQMKLSTVAVLAHLAANPSRNLRTLRFAMPPYDVGETFPDLRPLLPIIPELKRLSLWWGGRSAIPLPPLDVLSIRPGHAPFPKIPPVRVLAVEECSLDEIFDHLVDTSSTPVAIVMSHLSFGHLNRPGTIKGRDVPMSKLVVLGMRGQALSDLHEDIRYIVLQAPKLNYLTLDFTDRVHDEARIPFVVPYPGFSLTTLCVWVKGTEVVLSNWFYNEMRYLASPTNVVIRNKEMTQGYPQGIRSDHIDMIMTIWPDAKTICLPNMYMGRSTAAFTANVFTADRPDLCNAKYKELMWFDDVFHPGFDTI